MWTLSEPPRIDRTFQMCLFPSPLENANLVPCACERLVRQNATDPRSGVLSPPTKRFFFSDISISTPFLQTRRKSSLSFFTTTSGGDHPDHDRLQYFGQAPLVQKRRISPQEHPIIFPFGSWSRWPPTQTVIKCFPRLRRACRILPVRHRRERRPHVDRAIAVLKRKNKPSAFPFLLSAPGRGCFFYNHACSF